jgi:hypothetical protein
MARVRVNSSGPNKVKVIKVVREISGLGLKEAKDFVDGLDSGPANLDLLPGVTVSEASAALEAEGAGVSSGWMGDTGNSSFQSAVNSGNESSIIDVENPQIIQAETNNDSEPSSELSSPISTTEVRAGASFQPIVESKKVSQLDREDTMKVLVEVGKIAQEEEDIASEQRMLAQKKAGLLSQAEELRHVMSDGAKKKIWIGTGIAAVVGLIIIFPIGAIITALIGYFVLKAIIGKKDLEEHAAENNANAERFLESNLNPVLAQIADCDAKEKDFYASGKKEWALDIVGQDMYYSACIEDLYNLLQNRRADNLKEALNKYDDTLHRARMEEMQAAIKNASELSAEEAAKQTALAQAIEKNSHQAATAAKATAYHTRQIDKNTRRFR